MAQQDALAIIRKAASDDVFRRSLNFDFSKTIEDHNLQLADAEYEALKAVDWDVLGLGGDRAATWVHIYKSNTLADGTVGPRAIDLAIDNLRNAVRANLPR